MEVLGSWEGGEGNTSLLWTDLGCGITLGGRLVSVIYFGGLDVFLNVGTVIFVAEFINKV